jgi:FMNH2-dependent dimethyl sulfone monooxygenase
MRLAGSLMRCAKSGVEYTYRNQSKLSPALLHIRQQNRENRDVLNMQQPVRGCRQGSPVDPEISFGMNGAGIATINHLTSGRVAVNVVSGWFRGEFAAIGEHWLDHDERYRRSEEFIRALKGIWTQDDFTFRGDFYRFSNYTMKPKPIDPQPEIFQGGSSRAARDMAARVSDWYFTNGNTPEEIQKQVDDIREKAAANGHSVKIGVNVFAIARETEDEAREVLGEIIAKANPEAVHGFAHEVKNAGKASPEGQGNWAKSSFEDLVQYNDGFRSNLIGTPEQIAERIIALKSAGADLILLGFLHFQEEVEFFGKHVIPLVRELEARQAFAVAAE